MPIVPKLDPNEIHRLIPSPEPGRRLFLRGLPAGAPRVGIVLYVHGGTFPSATSIAHRIEGWSWRDALATAGFDVWGLDFHGFGPFSDPWPETSPAQPPLGGCAAASAQLEAAVRAILAETGQPRLSLIAHSWGSMVAGDLAGRCPELIERLALFAPIARRDGPAAAPLPAWRLITPQDQWRRFTADTPPGEAPVMPEAWFAAWAEAYLDGDPASRTRTPPAVATPCGPFQDIFDAWAGRLAYDPGRVRAPVALIRGAWASMCTDADAGWLLGALSGAAERREVVVPRAGHLMHLETARGALFRATSAFLAGG
ncbi:MAG: alpha/beta hydrolase [Acetobacteraceae bacterium]